MVDLQSERLARFGVAALEQGELNQAIAALEEAVKREPNRVDLLNALGIALARALRPVDALRYLQKSLLLAADDVEVLCVVGELSVERLDYDTAAKVLKRCLELDPKAQHPAGVRARALIKKAEKQLKKALGQA